MKRPLNIRGMNIVSAAICIFVGGLGAAVTAVKTDLTLWAVIAGLMIGFSLGAIYIGSKWEVKNI